MNNLNRFFKFLPISVVCIAGSVLCTSVTSHAQTSGGTNICPAAERLEREAALLQLNCDYRLNAIVTLQAQVPLVQNAANQTGISSRVARVYQNEVRVLNNRIKVAQRTANIACRAVTLRQGTVDRAQATCDASAPAAN